MDPKVASNTRPVSEKLSPKMKRSEYGAAGEVRAAVSTATTSKMVTNLPIGRPE